MYSHFGDEEAAFFLRLVSQGHIAISNGSDFNPTSDSVDVKKDRKTSLDNSLSHQTCVR